MSDCIYCHPEGLCTLKSEDARKCKFAVFEDENDVIAQCSAKNEDLQLLCECCESNVADAGFPNEELCKECAKERSDE